MGSETASAATQGPSQLAEATMGTDEQPEFADQASLDYMQAMAGFMGVVEAPKAADPAAEAEAALMFLNAVWAACEAQVG
jgi:hypothetical protein